MGLALVQRPRLKAAQTPTSFQQLKLFAILVNVGPQGSSSFELSRHNEASRSGGSTLPSAWAVSGPFRLRSTNRR
jgi:hypothetical protein